MEPHLNNMKIIRNEVFIHSYNAITSLGFDVSQHEKCFKSGVSGVNRVDNHEYSPEAFYASLVSTEEMNRRFHLLNVSEPYTRFEKLMILSAKYAIDDTQIDPASDNTLFIISTTKGNIDLLEENNKKLFPSNRIYLWKAASVISAYFGNPNNALVISNACISGVLALINACDFLSSGKYRNVVVIGGDIVSAFVVSGFQSFKSLSPGICKPFDASRDGLNLGEGAGTIILSTTPHADKITVSGGATANDANHISGPSRTGEGLYLAITKAIAQSNISASEIDFISAHGTATPFNDEMESKAFSRCGLENVPLNSFKAYIGHTLGGAGVIESAFALHGMKQSIIYPTLGYKEYGVPEKITIASKLTEKVQNKILKTASGFGGSNAAIVFKK